MLVCCLINGKNKLKVILRNFLRFPSCLQALNGVKFENTDKYSECAFIYYDEYYSKLITIN